MPLHSFDRLDLVREVVRGKGDHIPEYGQQFGRDRFGLGVSGPPMHDPVAHRVGRVTALVVSEPLQKYAQGRTMVGQRKLLLDQGAARLVPHVEPAVAHADPLHDPAHLKLL
jgi:hypothetical protein